MNFENTLLAITTLVLIWYTVETYRLRIESQKSNLAESMPVPVITFVATEAHTKSIDADYDISEKDVLITNVGKSAALNVRFSEVQLRDGEKVLYRMIHSNILEQGVTMPLAVTVLDDTTQGRRRGAHPHPYLIPGMIIDDGGQIQYDIPAESTYWKNYEYHFSILYDNPSGDSFEAKFSVDKHGAHPRGVIKTSF